MQQTLETLLGQWRDGDHAAGERVVTMVYSELRRLAAYYFRREQPGHTLQPTALVNEVFLKLSAGKPVQWKDRAHFAGVAAHLMRRILVQHARTHNAEKRGGKLEKLYLDETRELSCERPPELLAYPTASIGNFASEKDLGDRHAACHTEGAR